MGRVSSILGPGIVETITQDCQLPQYHNPMTNDLHTVKHVHDVVHRLP